MELYQYAPRWPGPLPSIDADCIAAQVPRLFRARALAHPRDGAERMWSTAPPGQLERPAYFSPLDTLAGCSR